MSFEFLPKEYVLLTAEDRPSPRIVCERGLTRELNRTKNMAERIKDGKC